MGRLLPQGVQPLGTAFSIASNTFCTTHHVTGGDPSNLVLIVPKTTGTELADYQDTSDPSARLLPASIAAVDPIRDIALLQFEGSGAPVYPVTGTDAVLPGHAVATLGYPHFDHGRFVLTRQDTNVGARILIETEGIKTKHLVLNIQTRPGQSGSPVFANGVTHVVAMVVGSYAPQGGGGVIVGGIDPQTLHQTTHAISVEYVPSML